MTNPKIELSFSYCVNFKVPVNVNNFSLIAVVNFWFDSDKDCNDIDLNNLEFVDYDNVDDIFYEDGRYDSTKAKKFRESYKLIFGNEFDADIEAECRKVLTLPVVKAAVELARPKMFNLNI